MPCVNMSNRLYTCIRVANCRYTAFISCTTGKVVPIASRSREAASAARHLHTLQTHTIPPVRCHPPRYSERLASEKNTTHLVQSDLLEHATVRKSRCESTGSRPARPLHVAAEATLASPWRRTSDRDLYADSSQSAYISYRSLSLVLLHGLARVASAASWSGLAGRIVLVLGSWLRVSLSFPLLRAITKSCVTL